jgi:hypothetical protein
MARSNTLSRSNCFTPATEKNLNFGRASGLDFPERTLEHNYPVPVIQVERALANDAIVAFLVARCLLDWSFQLG